MKSDNEEALAILTMGLILAVMMYCIGTGWFGIPAQEQFYEFLWNFWLTA